MMTVTFKQTLATQKPYSKLEKDEYLSLLEKNKSRLHRGDIGIYLSRKINLDGQHLYFPFIDLDGSPDQTGSDKIDDAIIAANTTAKTLKRIGVGDQFRFIATGGCGLRAASNILLNSTAYAAFVSFLKWEMPHIQDLQPTIDTEMPHQLFAYKGNPEQSRHEPVDGHSIVVPVSFFESGLMNAEHYRSRTMGRLDPDEAIEFVRWLLSGPVVSDLHSLGEFGGQLERYKNIAANGVLRPFSHNLLRKNPEPIALSVLKEMLEEKGILSRIERRGQHLALSFRGLPCPVCGKKDTNARAYPPSYTLKCFSSNCEAVQGVPLHVWSGIKAKGNSRRSYPSRLKSPENFIHIPEARELIRSSIKNSENTLIAVTPGVGKTHEALVVISELVKDKTVIYSAFNRDLQREAYNKLSCFVSDKALFHLLKPRDETCLRVTELAAVTTLGFSPAEILCTRCEHRKEPCPYYAQRTSLGTGAYFVTHHMLPYLKERIPQPDLIILDENLKAGFLLEETCTEIQMRSLLAALHGSSSLPVIDLLNIAQQAAGEVIRNNGHAMILNGRRLSEAGRTETSILELLSQRMNKSEGKVRDELATMVGSLLDTENIELYRRGISRKAIDWVQGLYISNRLSYMSISERGEISYKMKYITPLGYENTPIKVLDATGDAKTVESLLRRPVNAVNANVAWNSRKVHIQINTSRSVLKLAKNADLERLLTEMLGHIKASKVMVITYKFIKNRVMEILKQIDTGKEFMDYHFIGPRGINSFSECEAVLVLGLPYSNLNSCAQEACILVPDERNHDKRHDWIDASMQWELLQNIHRIRPVNKSNVEIVIAASVWPSVLHDPDLVIDRSRSENWKELAVQRLQPFVEALGFLNSDVGYLANLFLESKAKVADQFRRKLGDVLLALSMANSPFKVNSRFSTFFDLEGVNLLGDNRLPFRNSQDHLEGMRRKLIQDIYSLYILNLLGSKKSELSRISALFRTIKGSLPTDTLTPSNTNQWTELLIHFKAKYPHFEKFKIKLPHARNNYVSGVGDPKRVREFYQLLNDLEIFGAIDVNTYRAENSPTLTYDPIPEGFVSVYVPDDASGVLYVAFGDEFEVIDCWQDLSRFTEYFDGMISDRATQIVTNNGKAVAEHFVSAGIPQGKVIDVVLTERLISNGETETKAINFAFVLDKYGFGKGLEAKQATCQLVHVWQHQNELVDQMGLRAVFELEQKTIWVTAKIELAGIQVDVDGMLQYRESLLQLKCSSAVRRELDDIEKYIGLIGPDNRARDTIDQLNTKTGRFYRQLQTVKKDGPMRSFFKASEGCKLIISDYSQQEARIISGLSNDSMAISIFESSRDLYLEVASVITGKSVEHCGPYRKVAKEIVLGLNNGMSAYGIHDSLSAKGMPYDYDDVQGFVLRYNMAFCRIQQWKGEIVQEATNTGLIQTRLGRKLFAGKDHNMNSLLNFPVQATAADGFKMALLNLDGQLDWLNARIVHILHDEIIVEAKVDSVDKVASIVEGCMIEVLEKVVPEVSFRIKQVIQNTWR